VITADSACDYLFVSNAGPLGKSALMGTEIFEGARPRETLTTLTNEAGSVQSLRALFEGHYASVWRLLRRLGVPMAHLDDAAQEVFWVAARRLGDIEPRREHAFLYGVALRVASNILRRQRAVPAMSDAEALLEVADPQPSPEQALEQQQARALLDIVLSRLPLELRTVFVLFELEGLQVRDIAELEEIPIGTASSRLRRAREEFSEISKRLRATLGSRRGSAP
jgi:RNA polymerase sigma-70 factor, ECF subfamily